MIVSQWYEGAFDKATGVIASILTIIVAVTAFVRWFQSRAPRRGIFYRVETERYDIANLERFGVKMSLSGQPLEHVWHASIRVWNPGPDSITAEEFVTPLRFTLPSESRLLAVAIAGTDPKSLRESLDITLQDTSTAVIKPALLNSADRFDVHMLAMGTARSVDLSARIRGVTDVAKRRVYPPDVRLPGDKYVGAMLAFYIAGGIPDVLRITTGWFGYRPYLATTVVLTAVMAFIGYDFPVAMRRRSIFEKRPAD